MYGAVMQPDDTVLHGSDSDVRLRPDRTYRNRRFFTDYYYFARSASDWKKVIKYSFLGVRFFFCIVLEIFRFSGSTRRTEPTNFGRVVRFSGKVRLWIELE